MPRVGRPITGDVCRSTSLPEPISGFEGVSPSHASSREGERPREPISGDVCRSTSLPEPTSGFDGVSPSHASSREGELGRHRSALVGNDQPADRGHPETRPRGQPRQLMIALSLLRQFASPSAWPDVGRCPGDPHRRPPGATGSWRLRCPERYSSRRPFWRRPGLQ
jgi:hypothetical protein